MFSSDASKVVTVWITKGRIMSTSRDYFETAEATARVLETKRAVKNVTSSKPPINGDMTWSVSFDTLTGTWKVYGDETYGTIYEPRNGYDSRPYDLCSRGVFATIIVQSVTGRTSIAPYSRYEMKRAAENGEHDARARFRRAMTLLTDNPSVLSGTWRGLDNAEIWEQIESLAGPTYPNSLREARVPLIIHDAYDDAYYETATNLVATIR